MLLPSEGAGLAIRGLDPSLKKAIGSLADNRPVILARASFANYSSGSNITFLGYVFQPYSLSAGDMIRIELGGFQTNNMGVIVGASPFVKITQGTNIQIIAGGAAVSPDTAGVAYAWHTNILFSVNIVSADGQYVPATGTGAVAANSAYSSGLSPVQGIGFAGIGSTLLSDTTVTNPSFAAGKLLNSTPTTGSGAVGTIKQIAFDRSRPIRVEVQVSSASANNQWNVSSGVMEGL